jgi:heat shock protein HslJ
LNTKFCNTINGSYTIDEKGKMNGTLLSTLMACLDGESSKLESKFNIDGADIKVEGDKFTLTTKNNDIFLWLTVLEDNL